MHDPARCGEQPDERMTSSGPSILLPPEAALALCMCLHKLTTNSLKYGALSRPEGRVDVRWSLTQDAGLSFQWWGTRGGPRVTPPTRQGFGSRLMERLARHELNGEIERIYEPDGLVAIGRVRLPERSRWRPH
ncbi:hypothetical protein [Brevundimonas sp.]|uniref:hypothetical protein n=1 Tax=Brevundimonas sp. TaxID=1871086 RepID=UPI0035B0BCEE